MMKNVVLLNDNVVNSVHIDSVIEDIIESSNVEDTFQYVYTVWPSYKDVVIKMSHYMLDIIYDENKELLLIKCLKYAEQEVLKVIQEKQSKGFIEKIKEAFVDGLLYHTSGLLNHEIGIIKDQRKHVWEPSRETLYDFWLRENKKPVVLETFPDRKLFDRSFARNIIATRIFDHQTLRHLKPSLNLLMIDE